MSFQKNLGCQHNVLFYKMYLFAYFHFLRLALSPCQIINNVGNNHAFYKIAQRMDRAFIQVINMPSKFF